MSITHIRFSRRVTAGVAAVALGGALAACGSSGTTASTNATATADAARAGHAAPPAPGKPATGAAATKAKAAALAKYKGSVERVEQLADGSYVVHVIRSSGGEVHVKVSKRFKVTGTEQGGMPPGGRQAPAANGSTTQS